MALTLIKRGPRMVPVEVKPGTGWVNATVPGGSNPYIVGPGEQCVTVTATGCGGVRIYDWGRNPHLYVESAPGGTLHTATALVSGVGFGPVVRVLNPTDNTEATILSEPLPPPYVVEVLRAWWGGCRGAKETEHNTRSVRQRVARPQAGTYRRTDLPGLARRDKRSATGRVQADGLCRGRGKGQRPRHKQLWSSGAVERHPDRLRGGQFHYGERGCNVRGRRLTPQGVGA